MWGGGGEGGGDSYLKSDFKEDRVTKILNLALKIKGGDREGGTCEVLRPCPPPPKVWNVHKDKYDHLHVYKESIF